MYVYIYIYTYTCTYTYTYTHTHTHTYIYIYIFNMLPGYNTQLVLYCTYLQCSIYIGRPLPVYSIHPTYTTYTRFIARLYTTHWIRILPTPDSTGHQPPTAQTLPMYCCCSNPGHREGTIWLGRGGVAIPAHLLIYKYLYIYIIIVIYIYICLCIYIYNFAVTSCQPTYPLVICYKAIETGNLVR